MEFSNLEFLFRFLPIFLIIYYLVPVKYKNPVLFFGSLVFYAMGSWTDFSADCIASKAEFPCTSCDSESIFIVRVT